MDTSYKNIATSYPPRTFDESVLQSKSPHIGKYLLIALGIITLIGSIIATGCLYSQLGHTSFAIGGVGLILGFFCFLLSTRSCNDKSSDLPDLGHPQAENRLLTKTAVPHINVGRQIGHIKHESEIPIRVRLPCRHEGNSCFVNSALQIMAHLPDFRNLFDKDRNKLERGLEEKDDSLRRRQRVQETGNILINCILEGKQAEDLGNFVGVVNNALEAMGCLNGGGQPLKFDIQAGGDAKLLITYVESILISEGLVYCFPASYLNQLDQIREILSQEENPPTILVFDDNEENCPYCSEIIINGIGTYRLEAVRMSVGCHSKPIIRSQSGQFFILDDMVGRAEEIGESALSNILSHNKQSPSVYYVKVT